MLKFRRSFGPQDAVFSINGQGSHGTRNIGVLLTQTALDLQKAKSDSASFGGHFPSSGNNVIPAFKSPFGLDGPNALTGQIRGE